MIELHQIALVEQCLPVRQITWNPVIIDRFAFCCGTGAIYLWDRTMGCDAIQIPAVNFCVCSFKWNPDGKSMLLMDKDKFCVCFLIEE